MKFTDTKVVFREVPDEITLAINISGCPVKCPGCHSSYLTEDVGDILDTISLGNLIESNPGITCVSFMGGDADPTFVKELSLWVKDKYNGIKTCWYSGRNLKNAEGVIDSLDFIKVGPYIDEFGPLDSPTTNQRFYKIEKESGNIQLLDITDRFR